MGKRLLFIIGIALLMMGVEHYTDTTNNSLVWVFIAGIIYDQSKDKGE